MSELNVLSLFSGIGAFEKALDNLKIPYNLVGYCEIDKYASKSYSAIHNVSEQKNLKDVTTINGDELGERVDLITYGFPCQDISLAGKQKGLFNEDGSQTRSGLFFEALRIIETTKPKFAIAENVKNLVGKKFNPQFQVVLASLDSVGYNSYYAVLNAKDFGVPQNRERVFIISIRKDIDTGRFQFPTPIPLELRLKDVLEESVDEGYYLTEKQLNYAIDLNDVQKGTKWEGRCDNGTLNPTVAHTLGVRSANGQQRIGVSNFVLDGTDETVKVSDYKTALRNTSDPKVIGGIGEKKSNGGRQWYQQDRIYDGDNVAISIATSFNPYYSTNNLRIRKLTPKECFRLMGFDDSDFEKAASVCSDSQLYKQAGNSIVVNVLEAIFNSLGDCYEEFRS